MLAALMTGRDFDPRGLGPAVLEYRARPLDRGLGARDRLDARRFLDVDYRRLVEDPLGAVEAIYAHFGLPLGEAARAAMAAHVRANPRHKHGVHAYDLERYGLAEGLVRERLAAYLERFDLPRG
jgi:hypothetical protein